MPQIPNATAERIGVGGIVKLSSPCTVIIEKVGTGNIATVDGRSVYEFTEVGDYIFESTCECTGFYAITERGILTGCCPVFSAPDPDTGEITVIDENGTVVAVLPTNTDTDTITTGLTIDPVTRVVTITRTDVDGTALADLTATLPAATVDTDTIQTGATYDDATGILTQTFTDVDGVALPSITTDLSALKDNVDTDTIPTALTLDAATNVLTLSRTDIDGTALSPLTVDLSAYVDTDTDTIVTGIAFDPATGVTTITRTDKDGTALADLTADMSALDTNNIQTGATFDPLTNELTQTFTDKDGTALPSIVTDLSVLAADTAVTANTLVWDTATSSFASTVTEDGVDVVGTLAVPDGVRACGDRSLIKDAATGEIQFKLDEPDPDLQSGSIFSAAGNIQEDISVTSGGVPNGYRYAPEVCKTITNNSCEALRVWMWSQLIGDHSSTFTGVAIGTIHRLELSSDGGTTWQPRIVNKGITHTHDNTNAPSAALRTSVHWPSIERDMGTIPAGGSMTICYRVGHTMQTNISTADNHLVTTSGQAQYRLERL